jgi:predicted TIM-barrel fold metal-dependent hydrolase
LERDWGNLPLREYRPRPTLRVPVHEVPRARVPVVDVHNHLGRRSELFGHTGKGSDWTVKDVGELIALMDECNVGTIVNLDGHWGETLEANLNRYDRAHPGRFVTFCRPNWDERRAPGWPERLAENVRQSASRGAAGIKVWKDLGLRIRDEKGELVLCDDKRLEPMWEVAAELQLPILIHIADPPAHFEPLSEENERLEQLLAHPDWHYADPQFPRFRELIEALEHLVVEHPDTTFIGAHVGCYAQDLEWVGSMLDRCPNFYVDVAARIAELGRQPRATRRLVFRHPTRVLFGTDAFPPTKAVYATYFRFFETDDEHFRYSQSDPPLTGRWAISGVYLPDDVLVDVYSANAGRVIPALRRWRP